MATGKAAVLDRPLGTFSVEEFRVPELAPGTVLLRMELAGCCATDAHAYLDAPSYFLHQVENAAFHARNFLAEDQFIGTHP